MIKIDRTLSNGHDIEPKIRRSTRRDPSTSGGLQQLPIPTDNWFIGTCTYPVVGIRDVVVKKLAISASCDLECTADRACQDLPWYKSAQSRYHVPQVS